ncbi:TerB family tellurite resistance protein [Hyphococcus sp.]|uniref:tellurite resistance TerB family protein n=1 Tax=Hyphococcus sp. TaxID=2038636 RepID=UPI00208C10E5|nr:MAG: hypothetical protein DHS20C04_22490 [Marinicaulis sp.]
MFDKLFARFKHAAPEKESGDDALALSVAALLVEAARMDEHYEASEIAIIDRTLKSKFGLDDAGAAALRAKAETAQADATDIQRFTKVAKSMSGEEKIGLIETLWEIVLSDGTRDAYEDTLMRRICGLIYVDDQDSGAARARVAARLNLS